MSPSDFSTGLSLYPFRVLLFYTLYSSFCLVKIHHNLTVLHLANFLPTIDDLIREEGTQILGNAIFAIRRGTPQFSALTLKLSGICKQKTK